MLSFTSSSFTRKGNFVATITVSNGDRISTQDIVVENTAWGTITGRVIDGPLENAIAFLDLNSGAWDSGAWDSNADSDGVFELA